MIRMRFIARLSSMTSSPGREGGKDPFFATVLEDFPREGGEFQRGSCTVAESGRRMKVPRDFDGCSHFTILVSVVEKVRSLEVGGHKGKVALHLPTIMISLDEDELWTEFVDFRKPLERFARGCVAVDNVTDEDKRLRFPGFDESSEAVADRIHSPERPESTVDTAAHLVAEMQVRKGEPLFLFVKEGEPRIEKHPGDHFGAGDGGTFG